MGDAERKANADKRLHQKFSDEERRQRQQDFMMKNQAVRIQRHWRTRREMWLRKLWIIVFVQFRVRRWLARRRKAALTIQQQLRKKKEQRIIVQKASSTISSGVKAVGSEMKHLGEMIRHPSR